MSGGSSSGKSTGGGSSAGGSSSNSDGKGKQGGTGSQISSPLNPGRHSRPSAPSPATKRPGAPGTAGLSNAVGKKTGLGGVGNLAKNKSDGSAGGDAKQVGKNAATGAKIGSKIGGGPVGAAVGGAAGAGVGMLKSKKGRWLLLGVLSAPLLPMLLAFLLIISLLGSATATRAAEYGNQNDAVVLSGMVDPEEIESIASEYNVPWLIIAAIEFVGEQQGGTGVGSQNIDPQIYLKRHAEYVKADPEFDLTADGDDDAKSRRFMSWALARELEKSKYDRDEYPLDAGADHVEGKDGGPETREIIAKDPSSAKPAKVAEEIYKTAIEGLPLAGGKATAGQVYAIALQWALGKPVCSATSSIFVDGDWTSPIEGSIGRDTWGPRINPATGRAGWHSGSDIGAPSGSPVYSASAGKVKLKPRASGFGNTIIIDHGGGFATQYSHLLKFLVSDGQTVTVGTKIALSGGAQSNAADRGNSTGPHLHFEVHVPSSYNPSKAIYGYVATGPVQFMLDRGVKLGSKPGSPAAKDAVDLGLDPNADPDSISAEIDPSAGKIENGTFTATNALGQSITFNQEQIDNAKEIVSVGRQKKVSDKGLVIALMTAMQESTLRNLDYGDRDSLGLFQQRAGWGSAADRQTPSLSAGYFFSALLKTPGWEGMDEGEAAQTVQRSAFPDAYDKWKPVAEKLLEAIGGSSLGTGCNGASIGMRVVTYNVCSVVTSCASKMPAWSTRARMIAESVREVSPDVAVFQELSRSNLADMLWKELAPEYHVAGNFKGEYILVKTTTISELDASGAKLPGGGLKMKRTGGSSERHAVYQTLRDLNGGSQFLQVGIHTSASAGTSKDLDRQYEIKKLFEGIASVRGTMRVVVAGDINSFGRKHPLSGRKLADKVFQAEGFTSAEDLAATKVNYQYDSWNGFRTQKSSGRNGWHMDHVYVPDGTPVAQWGVRLNGGSTSKFESDHNLVWADVVL